MTLSAQQLAELLAGIARAQTAIIEAVERAEGGWRNTHLIPLLTVAANMRVADARLIDLPSRVLLRAQSRAPLDVAAISADLERLLGAVPAPASQAATAAAAGGDELDFSPKAG
jgi:hypothetical protein